MSNRYTYEDEAGNIRLYPEIGQGPAEPADDEDKARDALGFTHPNLHRRIVPKPANRGPYEVADRSYKLTIGGYNSFRTTELVYHDEENNPEEIP